MKINNELSRSHPKAKTRNSSHKPFGINDLWYFIFNDLFFPKDTQNECLEILYIIICGKKLPAITIHSYIIYLGV